MNDTINHAEGARAKAGLADAIQNALDVHARMTAPRGVTNQTMHGCEMCDALNAVHSAFVLDLAARSPHTPEAVEEAIEVLKTTLLEWERGRFATRKELESLRTLINAAKPTSDVALAMAYQCGYDAAAKENQ